MSIRRTISLLLLAEPKDSRSTRSAASAVENALSTRKGATANGRRSRGSV